MPDVSGMPGALWSPVELGAIQLRNRVIRAATYEGMTRNGVPTRELAEYHGQMASNGVGLTTVAYAAVSEEGMSFDDQLLMTSAAKEGLVGVSDAVHGSGGAVSVQLAHCGGFTKSTRMGLRPPRGPSLGFNPLGGLKGRGLVLAMEDADIARTISEFARATHLAVESGFDAVELHLGHGYLLSQFLSPIFNRRTDRWGGSRDNRMRFPLDVVAAVRMALGPDRALLAKVNLDDGVPGGWGLEDCMVLVNALEHYGVDAVVLSGGLVSRSPFYLLRGARPLVEMIRAEESWIQRIALAVLGPFLVKRWSYQHLYFLEKATRVRRKTSLPLVLLGGVTSTEHVAKACESGFEFVAIGRGLISDPDLVERMKDDRNASARCTHCNLCVARIEHGLRCWEFEISE